MARRKMTPARAKAKAAARRQKVKDASEALVNDVLGPLMDEGRAPQWSKPWSGILSPTSMATGNPYAGRNRLVLMLRGSGYTAPIWMTFNRAKTLSLLLAKERGETHAEKKDDGGVYYGVKADEGQTVIFKPITRRFKTEVEVDGVKETEERHWREFTVDGVYNVGQTDLPLEWVKEKIACETDMPDVVDLETFNGMLDHVSAVMPELEVQVAEIDAAYYSPSKDLMQVPPAAAFKDEAGMNEVLIHEAIHATGAAKRLARPGCTVNALSRTELTYAVEEVTAELGASLYCSMMGIEHDVAQHADYIQGWASRIHDAENATQVMLRVIDDAVKAVDWLLGGPLEGTPEGDRAASE